CCVDDEEEPEAEEWFWVRAAGRDEWPVGVMACTIPAVPAAAVATIATPVTRALVETAAPTPLPAALASRPPPPWWAEVAPVIRANRPEAAAAGSAGARAIMAARRSGIAPAKAVQPEHSRRWARTRRPRSTRRSPSEITRWI